MSRIFLINTFSSANFELTVVQYQIIFKVQTEIEDIALTAKCNNFRMA